MVEITVGLGQCWLRLLSHPDKQGIFEHLEWCFHGFCETVFSCGLFDLTTSGYPFTWICMWKSLTKCRKGWTGHLFSRVGWLNSFMAPLMMLLLQFLIICL